jgi:hypothetical protein
MSRQLLVRLIGIAVLSLAVIVIVRQALQIGNLQARIASIENLQARVQSLEDRTAGFSKGSITPTQLGN